MLGIACVGTGYWGKNLLRNFASIKQAQVRAVCDSSPGTLDKLRGQYPGVLFTDALDPVMSDPAIQAVVIATPAPSHFDLARQALEAGKHVFVEKPMTLLPEHAAELNRLAALHRRVLMVGHLMEYHPGVRWIRDHLSELGRIYYLYAQRLNLGIVRKDENCWWSLAPHDISIMLYVLGEFPVSVTARGACYLRPGVEDVVFATLKFPSGALGQIHVSWLDPHKSRKLTLVGDKKMITFDDMEASEKIKVFDKGAQVELAEGGWGDHITLRSGDILMPRLDMTEPLKTECEHFVHCCLSGNTPTSDGEDGARVVRILNACQASLVSGGGPVEL